MLASAFRRCWYKLATSAAYSGELAEMEAGPMKSHHPSAWARTAPVSLTVFAALLTMWGTASATLWAGSNKWTSIGPFGGSIQSMAIDPQNPSTLYTGTSSGIFKSTDGGTSWNSISDVIAAWTLAIDPGTPSTLYAGGVGLFKSTDGGTNWNAASSGLSSGPAGIRTLAIDPQNPKTLYAGTSRG